MPTLLQPDATFGFTSVHRSVKLGLNQKAATTCHAYAHGFISMLFLKESGSYCLSCCFNTTAKRVVLPHTLIGSFSRTCFMTVLQRCASYKSDNLLFRAFAL